MRKIIFTSVLLLIELIVTAQKKDRPADQLYITQLKGAEAYYRLNQIGEAKKILQEIPSAKRGWEWQLLHARMDRSVQTLREHNKSVVGIAVSTDGKYLATGSADSSIIIWDADNYLPVKQITGHKGQVTTLSFSPDGKTLLSGSTDKTLRLWDITEGKEIRNFNTEFRQGIYQSVFSADGKNIAACSWELSNGVVGFAKVIDVMTGKLVRRFNTDDHPASSIKFSADGNKLFSGTWGFHIKQHDVATGQTDWDYDLNQFNYYTAVQSIDVSSDGKHVVQCGKDNRIRLLDASNGKLIYQIEPWQGHAEWVNAVRFSPDGKYFASGSDDGMIKVWETVAGKTILMLRGHEGGLNQLAWHPDGKRIFSTSADATIKAWDISQPGERNFDVADSGPWSAPVSADGNLIVVAGSDKKITVWNLNTALLENLFDGITANAASFSNNAKFVFTAGHDKMVYGFDIVAKKEVFRSIGHTNSIFGMDINDEKEWIATASADRTARIWNKNDGKLMQTINTFGGSPYAIRFAENGSEVLIGCTNGKVYFVNTSTWQIIDSIQSGNSVGCIMIDPSGRYLITGGSNKGEVYTWNLKKRELLYELKGHTKWVYGITFHPTQSLAVTASYDRSVRIWNLNTGQNVLALYGFADDLFTTSITSDGKRLVITEVSGNVHVINL